MDIRQAIGFITGKAAKHPYPEHMQDARKIAADGIVLLKNEGIYCRWLKRTGTFWGGRSGYHCVRIRLWLCYGTLYDKCHAGIGKCRHSNYIKNWLKRYQEASKKQIRKIRLCPNWIGHGLALAF